MAKHETSPSVYDYQDYRTFLHDFYLSKKKTTPSYSYKTFAIKARLKSPNYLKLVIDGQRRLTDKYLGAFLKGLGLDTEAALYFRFLVELSQETDSARIAELSERLHKLKIKNNRIPTLITTDRSKILEKWSYWIIREMAGTKGFELDAKWIANRLSKKISIAEAQEAIDLLIDLKFLVKDHNQKYIIGEALVSSGDEEENRLLRGLHKQLIEISLESLERDAISDREFGAVTVALPKHKVAKAKELMKKFRREFHQLMSEDENIGEEVYQLNLAFFPLTQQSKGVLKL